MNSPRLTDPHLTDFQRRVYNALLKIPQGKVTTYKILAKYLSATGRSACGVKCGSYRAVGQALRCNPFAPQVPCHRVIASNLTPGGFSALGETSSNDGQGKKTGAPIRRKLKLLAAEGVKFVNGRLADPNQIYRYSKATS